MIAAQWNTSDHQGTNTEVTFPLNTSSCLSTLHTFYLIIISAELQTVTPRVSRADCTAKRNAYQGNSLLHRRGHLGAQRLLGSILKGKDFSSPLWQLSTLYVLRHATLLLKVTSKDNTHKTQFYFHLKIVLCIYVVLWWGWKDLLFPKKVTRIKQLILFQIFSAVGDFKISGRES